MTAEMAAGVIAQKYLRGMLLRLLPLVSALALLLAPSNQAAAFVASPASISPMPENASTAFFEGGSESRIGLLCHNDPVNNADPTGLYVSGLTSFGGGDWVGGLLNITNRERDLIQYNKLRDFLYSAGAAAAKEAARYSHSERVEHGGAFGQSDTNPGELVVGKRTASDLDPRKMNDTDGRHGLYNVTDFTTKPLPPGFHAVGGYWGLVHPQNNWPTGDRLALWKLHMSGVIGIPA